MQVKGQRLRASRCRAARRRSSSASIRRRCRTSSRRPSLKGKKLGVTAPGSSHQRARQLRARQGRPQAGRRLDHRRRHRQRRGRGDAHRPDRRDLQPRPGDHAADAQRRPEDHLRHAHRRRGRQGVRRADAGRLPLHASRPSSTSTRRPAQALDQRAGARRPVGPGARARATSSRRCRRATCSATVPSMSTPSSPPRARSRPTALFPEAGAGDGAARVGEHRSGVAAAKIDLAAIYTNDFVEARQRQVSEG